MDKVLFRARLGEYMTANFNFGLYYDKIYKKEYLPSRIRYNQFFFYTFLVGGIYMFSSKKNGGSLFCPAVNSQQPDDQMAHWKYYTSDRAVVNFLMRQVNKQNAKSQAQKQNYCL